MAFIYYVTHIQFEAGAIKLLKQECDRVGISRPLIITDQGVKAAGILQKTLDHLLGVTVAVFDQTPSNPTEAAVRAAAASYKANHCDGVCGPKLDASVHNTSAACCREVNCTGCPK